MAKKSKKTKKPVKKAKTIREEKSQRGQPTKYDESYCQAVIDWFVSPYDEDHDAWKGEIRVRRLVDGKYVNVKEPVYIPNIRDFASSIGVSLNTLYAWVDAHAEFAEAYEEAMVARVDLIQKYAVTGVINPNFAKYMLESWHPRKRVVPESEKTEEEKESECDGYHIKITVVKPPDWTVDEALEHGGYQRDEEKETIICNPA